MSAPPRTSEQAARALANRRAAMLHAQSVQQARSAHRAVDDPTALGRAARIVRAALGRRMLTLNELTVPLPHPDGHH